MDFSRYKLKPHKLFHHLEEVIKWKKRELFPPIYVEINPTDRCNQKCVFCYTKYLGHKALSIPDGLLIKIFKDMGEYGVKSVLIQGTGEPLLHESLPDAILEGKDSGLDIALCTNGSLLNDELVEKIVPHLTFLRISAFEASKELYAKTHGVNEAQWRNVVEGLKAAVRVRNREKNDTLIQATFIPLDHNLHSVVETVCMLKDIGVDYVMIKPPQHSYHNQDLIWDREAYASYSALFDEARALGDDTFLVNARWDMADIEMKDGPFRKTYKKCYGVEFEVAIDANSKIYPCFQYWRDDRFCLGDLNEKSFSDIWSGEERRTVMNRFYKEADLDECRCQCKQHHINETLWELANPPLHVNFL